MLASRRVCWRASQSWSMAGSGTRFCCTASRTPRMNDPQDRVAPVTGQLGVLARDFQARLVNCSPSGCLLETNARVEVGTIGTLRVTVDGREFADDVQVVRCQA